MTTGVHRISNAALIERELVCQTGQTLRDWAEERGVPVSILRNALDGTWANDELLMELASTLGVSVTSLRVSDAVHA